MSNDVHDIEWRCACGHTNPDFETGCRGCGEERYPEKEVTRVQYLEAALRKISEGRGRFSRDQLIFAGNTIEDMKNVATDALAGMGDTSVSYGQVAAKVRAEKEKYPERFCPKCLWRIQTSRGPNPCRKHPIAESAHPPERVSAPTEVSELSPPHSGMIPAR